MILHFLKRCWQSLKGSYQLPLPFDPFIIKDWKAWTKKRWWVFLRPIKYSCWRANWKLSKKLDRQDPFGEAMKEAYEEGGLFHDMHQAKLDFSKHMENKKKEPNNGL